MLNTYLQSEALPGPVLFDRGIPDILGYAALFGANPLGAFGRRASQSWFGVGSPKASTPDAHLVKSMDAKSR
jgi:hypothetical protein